MLKQIWTKSRRTLLELCYGDEYVATTFNVRAARSLGVTVGENCRLYSLHFSTEPYLIEIGNHVTITDRVYFLTHDGAVWVFREQQPAIELFGRITLGNNVFIGTSSLILPNTTIGDNSVVGAGSVVKGTFPPNSIIAGVPAKRICGVEEYYHKHLDDFTFIRNLPPDATKEMIPKRLADVHSQRTC